MNVVFFCLKWLLNFNCFTFPRISSPLRWKSWPACKWNEMEKNTHPSIHSSIYPSTGCTLIRTLPFLNKYIFIKGISFNSFKFIFHATALECTSKRRPFPVQNLRWNPIFSTSFTSLEPTFSVEINKNDCFQPPPFFVCWWLYFCHTQKKLFQHQMIMAS